MLKRSQAILCSTSLMILIAIAATSPSGKTLAMKHAVENPTTALLTLWREPWQPSNPVIIGMGGYGLQNQARLMGNTEPVVIVCAYERLPVRAFVAHFTDHELIYSWTSTGGSITGEGSIISLNTAGLRNGDYKVKVRVDKRSGGVVGTAQKTVRIQPCNPNMPATVNVEVSSATVCVGKRVEVNTIATDPDGDTLLYAYSATAGRIIGDGPSAIWDLSGVPPGTYTATVEVDDGTFDIVYPWTIESHAVFRSITVQVTSCRR